MYLMKMFVEFVEIIMRVVALIVKYLEMIAHSYGENALTSFIGTVYINGYPLIHHDNNAQWIDDLGKQNQNKLTLLRHIN